MDLPKKSPEKKKNGNINNNSNVVKEESEIRKSAEINNKEPEIKKESEMRKSSEIKQEPIVAEHRKESPITEIKKEPELKKELFFDLKNKSDLEKENQNNTPLLVKQNSNLSFLRTSEDSIRNSPLQNSPSSNSSNAKVIDIVSSQEFTQESQSQSQDSFPLTGMVAVPETEEDVVEFKESDYNFYITNQFIFQRCEQYKVNENNTANKWINPTVVYKNKKIKLNGKLRGKTVPGAIYNVNVVIVGNERLENKKQKCTCPQGGREELCKHAAALLYCYTHEKQNFFKIIYADLV